MNDPKSGAIFSACKNYRYTLWRKWGEGRTVAFCLLNPSTADARRNDPTVTRCIARAKAMGYAGIEVVNIFAWKSTDPKQLQFIRDPVGKMNDKFLLAAMENNDKLICGWGTHGWLNNRQKEVLKLFKNCDKYVLAFNQNHTPKHPLYVGYNVREALWDEVFRRE